MSSSKVLTVNDYKNLGESGLKVSKVIVGCMQFGSSEWVSPRKGEEETIEILWKCYQAGLRTFDTADMYSNGLSEIYLAKFLKQKNIPRESVVILTKCYYPYDEDHVDYIHFVPSSHHLPPIDFVNRKGLSRKYIFDAVKRSVERLGTYIDVLQIHRLDQETPKKEIMKALNDVVESGQVRYIGASTMKAVEFAELQFIAHENKWHKFISMQNYYNLLYREEEREMIPFCENTSFGKATCIPWSPLAVGLLAKSLEELNATADDPVQKATRALYGFSEFSKVEEKLFGIIGKIADAHKTSRATVSLAWLIAKGCCPITGVNSVKRVDDLVDAIHLKLTDEDIKALDETYVAKEPVSIF